MIGYLGSARCRCTVCGGSLGCSGCGCTGCWSSLRGAEYGLIDIDFGVVWG